MVPARYVNYSLLTPQSLETEKIVKHLNITFLCLTLKNNNTDSKSKTSFLHDFFVWKIIVFKSV